MGQSSLWTKGASFTSTGRGRGSCLCFTQATAWRVAYLRTPGLSCSFALSNQERSGNHHWNEQHVLCSGDWVCLQLGDTRPISLQLGGQMTSCNGRPLRPCPHSVYIREKGFHPLPKREVFTVEPTLTLDDFFFEFLSCKDLIWRTNHIQFWDIFPIVVWNCYFNLLLLINFVHVPNLSP